MITKGEVKNIAISSNSYSNFIDIMKKKISSENVEKWFNHRIMANGSKYYTASLVNDALKQAFKD